MSGASVVDLKRSLDFHDTIDAHCPGDLVTHREELAGFRVMPSITVKSDAWTWNTYDTKYMSEVPGIILSALPFTTWVNSDGIIESTFPSVFPVFVLFPGSLGWVHGFRFAVQKRPEP